MRNLGINGILTLYVTLSVLVGIGALVAYVSSSTYAITESLQEESLAQTARITTNILGVFVENAKRTAANLAAQPAAAAALGGEKNDVSALVENTLTVFPEVLSVVFFDNQGRAVAGRNRHGNLADSYADREYCKAILSGQQAYVTRSILRDKAASDMVFVVSHAVNAPDGKRLGGVAVAIMWETITKEYIDPIRFGKKGYAFMIDEAGVSIAHARKELLLRDTTDLEYVRLALALPKGLVNYTLDGEAKQMTVAQVPATGWILCMSEYEAELMSGATRQRNLLLGLGVLVAGAVVAVITVTNKRLVFGPLRAIDVYTGHVATGDFNVALVGKFRYELAELAANVRNMVGELKTKLGFAEGVMNGIPTACAIVGPDIKMAWINKHMCALHEKTDPPASYIGLPAGLFYHGDASRETASKRALRERHVATGELVHVTPSGKKLNISVITTPFYDMDGNLLGCIVFWRDQTEIVAQQERIDAQNALMTDTASKASDTSDRMAAAAEELSAQIEQANQGAQEQNNRVQDTVTAVEEMNATILEVAKNAGNTAQNADSAREKAREGAQLVTEVVAAVDSVREAADRLKENMRGLGDRPRASARCWASFPTSPTRPTCWP
ncbi:MAG: cache domain-containing protein [Solidesulfovibrio sp.]